MRLLEAGAGEQEIPSGWDATDYLISKCNHLFE
jgi:hypothetical protein